MPSTPLPTKYEVTKQEEAQMPEAGPNAVEPPGRPLGLSAGNIASASGPDTSLSFASEPAIPEKAEVPKVESAAPDQSGRPLGLSDAGSAARSFPGILLQFASESAKPEEAGEADESMECASLTSEESLSPLQTVIVVGPNADGALGEVSIEAVTTANSPNAPPGVERSADPPTLKIAPKSPVHQRRGR